VGLALQDTNWADSIDTKRVHCVPFLNGWTLPANLTVS